MLANVLNRSLLFEFAHPEVVSEFVNQKVGRHTIEILKHERAGSRLSFTEFSEFGLTSISYGSEVRIRSPELEGVFHLQIITKGKCYVSFKDETVLLLDAGDAMMLNPYELITLEYSSDCEKLIINVPESAVQSAVLSELGFFPKSGIRFERRPINVLRFPSLVKLFETVFLEVEESNTDYFCVFDPYKEILLKKLIGTFSSNIQIDKDADRVDPSMAIITKYIDENLKNNITIEELAGISKLSVRSIYSMFSNSFSTTPRSYIKNRKLQRVREDLLNGSARNVTEVALDYGFMHLGRLSCDYKKLFGELPSETKRSS